MRDYSISGPFGQVKLSPSFPKPLYPSLDWIADAGWHRVNEQYRIHRPNGLTGYLVLVTVSGFGREYIQNTCFDLMPNTVWIIPPDVCSGYYTPSNGVWEFYWVHLIGDNAAHVLNDLLSLHDFRLHLDTSVLVRRIGQLIEPDINDAFFISRTASKLLFDLLSGVTCSVSEGAGGVGAVSTLLSWIEENYTQPFSLSAVCAETFFSEEHFIRLFRKATGVTPYRYYKQYKLKKSSELLVYTDIPVKEIASSIGYSGADSYGVQFKKEFGVSPSNYRKQNRVY